MTFEPFFSSRPWIFTVGSCPTYFRLVIPCPRWRTPRIWSPLPLSRILCRDAPTRRSRPNPFIHLNPFLKRLLGLKRLPFSSSSTALLDGPC